MKNIGFFIGAFVLAFVFAASHADNMVFANSCCGVQEGDKECNKEGAGESVKKVSTDEKVDNNCPVCGVDADSKGKRVDVEHGGKTVHLCCQGCANAYNENPDKYTEDTKPGQSYKEKSLNEDKGGKKKQRGEGYY